MNRLILILLLLILTIIDVNAAIVHDEIAANLTPKSIPVYTDYNYESTVKIPIKLKIKNPIKSEADIYEGEVINFIVTDDVLYKNSIIIKKDSCVSSIAKIIVNSGMNGIPASIILTDFKIDGITNGQFSESYEIFGQDRSLFVFPLKWALTPFPPTGSLTNLIKGGRVKFSKRKKIIIYYYPEWI